MLVVSKLSLLLFCKIGEMQLLHRAHVELTEGRHCCPYTEAQILSQQPHRRCDFIRATRRDTKRKLVWEDFVVVNCVLVADSIICKMQLSKSFRNNLSNELQSTKHIKRLKIESTLSSLWNPKNKKQPRKNSYMSSTALKPSH